MRTEEAIKNGHSKEIGKHCNETDVGLGLWYLTPLSTIFQLCRISEDG